MKFKVVPAVLSLGGAFLIESTVTAQIQFDLNCVFSGADTPPVNASGPWVTAMIEDSGPRQVIFTLQASQNLTGSENISQFYFNFDDALDLGALSFTLLTSSGSFTAPSWTFAENALKADGDGKYDIRLDFVTGGNTDATFNRNDRISYLLTYGGAETINTESFIYLSRPAGGNGPFFAAAHVQNTFQGGSAWLSPAGVTYTSIPEPTSISLLGLTGMVWVAARRLARRRPAV